MKIQLYILFVLASSSAFSQNIDQNVLSSGGGYLSSASGELSFTLGEMAIATYNNGSNEFTQGFHQTNYLFSSIKDYKNNLVKVYPNPSSNLITLDFIELSSHTIELFSISGKLISSVIIENRPNYTLNLEGLETGIYLLQVNTKNSNTNTYKIQKIQ